MSGVQTTNPGLKTGSLEGGISRISACFITYLFACPEYPSVTDRYNTSPVVMITLAAIVELVETE